MLIKCPYQCGANFEPRELRPEVSNPKEARCADGDLAFDLIICPGCSRPIVDLTLYPPHCMDDLDLITRSRVWPRSGRMAPPVVPEAIARDYNEGAFVLDRSPRASAALARRCLEQVLEGYLSATGSDLKKQIDSVKEKVPENVYRGLHGLRTIGNFSVHLNKDTNTGQIVDVEPEEAEWTLEVLDLLFDFLFVAPARAQERIDGVNSKLKASGKPLIE
jgi:hypothetical protein